MTLNLAQRSFKVIHFGDSGKPVYDFVYTEVCVGNQVESTVPKGGHPITNRIKRSACHGSHVNARDRNCIVESALIGRISWQHVNSTMAATACVWRCISASACSLCPFTVVPHCASPPSPAIASWHGSSVPAGINAVASSAPCPESHMTSTGKSNSYCRSGGQVWRRNRNFALYENRQWVTLSFRNTKVLHQSVTPNLNIKSNCWTLV